MKFWRTTAAFALVGAFSAASAIASLAPKAPAAAGTAVSSGSGSTACAKSTEKTLVDGLTLCVEMINDTQGSFGNGFPWENSTFFFATYRNQYLYPSATLSDARNVTDTIESIGARSVSFGGASTNVFGSMPNGADSFIRVTDNVTNSLALNFAANTGPTTYCELLGTDASPIIISTRTGPKGSTVSQCGSCVGDEATWCSIGNLFPTVGAFDNLMVDHLAGVGVGNSGGGVWDVTSDSFGSGCAEPSRAYGSGSFANANHLTTAYGVDKAAFVWVFIGTAPPPPATVEQQIKEIVRLLLTPEGLRCSGLDLNPGNKRIEDDPIAFPDGASVDPVQPQVTTGGLRTGDELVDGIRTCGFDCP